MSGNIYYNGAKPSDKDVSFTNDSTFNPGVKLVEEGENGYLHLTFNNSFYDHKGKIITTEILGKAKIPKAAFDNPDGTPLRIDHDFFGNVRTGETTVAGPFSNLNKGSVVLKVW
jgi:hypothetical protein